MARSILGRSKNSAEVLQYTTLREFDGGWNVVDNDLNMKPSFAKVMENMYRGQDGGVRVRWGTRLFADLYVANSNARMFNTNVATTNGSNVVTITVTPPTGYTTHNIISGHDVEVSLASYVNPFGGIPRTDIIGKRSATYVSDTKYSIVADSTATSTSSTDISLSDDYTDHIYDTKVDTGNIIYTTYYQDHIIAVLDTGVIFKIDASQNKWVIWNDNIAALLSGAPSGWSSSLTFATGAVFNRELILCNGIDKPVIINLERTPATTLAYTQYLYDLGNPFSNVNVPVARYVLAMNRFLVMAGDLNSPGKLYISSRDTSGTWEGDAGSNGISIDLSKYTTTNNQTIRGLARFDDKLFVLFDEGILIGTLGTFNGSTHEPDFSSSLAAFGGIAHHSAVSLGNDLFTCDYAGVPSIARALFTGAFRPERVSELVGPEIQTSIANLTVGASEDRIWAIYNRKEGQYMLFIPNNSVASSTTETLVYVYTSPIGARKAGSWSRFRGMNFRHGCRSALDRLFFGQASKIYIYGTEEDPIHSDLMPDTTTDGTPITFDWTFPWGDFGRRMEIKTLRYIQLDASGQAGFNVELYVDNLDIDSGDSPVITIPFTARDSAGYGEAGYGVAEFGGGRSTAEERLYAARTKFKILKIRIQGSATTALRIIGLSLAYIRGRIRR